MSKLKHIWVFSDSIKGHEVQSMALAKALSDNVTLFHCTIRQPWLTFAPRILPRFGRNIIWEKHKPDRSKPPSAIISCGRRMAAIGKFHKRALNCPHIQILNPGDNPKKYDLLIVPEHDDIKGANIIRTKGSLHPINLETLAQVKKSKPFEVDIVLLLGNPSGKFFNHQQLESLTSKISHHYPESKLAVCGSRRTPKKYIHRIKTHFDKAHFLWLSDEDGENPYLKLLANGNLFLVTADSINMLSETCATDKPVIALAQELVSPKHKRFLASINKRLSNFTINKNQQIPLEIIKNVKQQVLSRFHH